MRGDLRCKHSIETKKAAGRPFWNDPGSRGPRNKKESPAWNDKGLPI